MFPSIFIFQNLENHPLWKINNYMYWFYKIFSNLNFINKGNRYIELFLKSVDCPPLSGIGPNGQYLYMVQMRGLPFKVTPKDICNVRFKN